MIKLTNSEIRKRIDKTLDAARKDHDAVLASIKSYQQRFDDATAEMDKAISESDLEAYSVATARQADANRALTLYKAKRASLEEAPLMEREQYQAMRADVIANYDAVYDQTKDRLKEIANELDQMRSTLENAATESNKLLHSLQYDISRGDGLKYLPSGGLAWESGEWTVTPRNGKYRTLHAMLTKLTPKQLDEVLK